MRSKRLLALVLGLALLCSCTPRQSAPTPTPEVTPGAEGTPAPTPDAKPEPVRVAVLKGVTGLGAAKLMEDGKNGETGNEYVFSLLAEATEAVAALTKGEADIAALPTNLASTLYHKTDGGIQLLSLCAYGVLYILENGYTVNSVADLRGRTIHAFGQGANPEFILNYLLTENGLTPGEDVTVQWYSTTDEVSTLMAAGEIELCMLPVPAATAVLMQNDAVRSALDLTLEWESAGADGVLTMSCVVVRTQFAQAHPDQVEAFLKDLEGSISYMSDPDHLDTAAALAETWGIIPKAAIARMALPDANLCFITGDEMMDDIQGYYQVLYAADPASIGGSIPDGAFYYGQS